MPRFLLVLFLLISRAALSQTTDSAQVATSPTATFPPKSSYKISFINEFGITAAYTNMANMKSFFRQNHIKGEAFGDPFIHYYTGVRYKRLKLLAQIGYGVNYYGPNERDALVVRRTYASYTGGQIGYDVLNDRNTRLYLSLGAGTLQYDYAVVNRTNQSGVAYTGGLARYSHEGNIPSLKLTNGYWDANLELSQREKRKANASLVLRLGYRRGWRANKWQAGPYEIPDFPADRISQLYLQLGLHLSSNLRPQK